MASKRDPTYFEDQPQVDALEEFAPKIREILRYYRDKRQLSSIARKFGFHLGPNFKGDAVSQSEKLKTDEIHCMERKVKRDLKRFLITVRSI